MVCPDLDFDFVLFFFFSGTSADLSLVVAVGGDALRLELYVYLLSNNEPRTVPPLILAISLPRIRTC